MALRDQPYIPLYVQDYLTDEKLNECSASTQGVYIKLMCVMHKSDEYGCILLEQKYKQTDNQIKNFALKLVKHLPFCENEIFNSLTELLNEKVIILDGDKIYQKRMVKDNKISLIRAESGKKGGEKTQFDKANVKANVKANKKAKSEYENEYEYKIEYNSFITVFNEITNKNFKGTKKDKRQFHARIEEGFTIENFRNAITNCKNDKFHIENPHYLTPEFITRSDKLQKYMNVVSFTSQDKQPG